MYPKPTDKPLYKGLVTQAKALNLPLHSWADIKVGLMLVFTLCVQRVSILILCKIILIIIVYQLSTTQCDKTSILFAQDDTCNKNFL